jgi:hypothetical protein
MGADSGHPGRGDIRASAGADRVTAGQLGQAGPPGDGHREDQVTEAGTECADHRQRQDEGRKPEQQVDQAGGADVEDAAEKARRGPHRDADHRRQREHQQRRPERGTGASDRPGEFVPAVAIGAQPVQRAWRGELTGVVGDVRSAGEDRPDQGQPGEHDRQGGASPETPVPGQGPQQPLRRRHVNGGQPVRGRGDDTHAAARAARARSRSTGWRRSRGSIAASASSISRLAAI